MSQKDVESATIENGGVGRTPFDIELSGCATGISGAQVSFSSEEFANLTDGTLNNDTTIDDAAKMSMLSFSIMEIHKVHKFLSGVRMILPRL
ncbi:hypothetical protein [Salmonella enterica]|uniref:hypothetical protein n=1 Tax=Salmonella enterica TaxID=28901 RepID=UPI0013B05D54|nr:hypothetical protein [Salmonella enterica]